MLSSAPACNGVDGSGEVPLGYVGDEPIYPSVVAHVATREGISKEEAQQHVADTLRWVAAAREERAAQGGDPPPEIPAAREAHLRRAAQARLWLDTEFEPKHRAQDIPEDYLPLQQARNSPKLIHPMLHRLCQVIVLPSSDDAAERERLATDSEWLAKAHARMTRLEARLNGVLRTDDARACELMQDLLVNFQLDDGELRVTVEAKAFHVEACATQDEEGNCRQKRFVEPWREAVGAAREPGFLPAFETRFGVHLVFLLEIMPARSGDDPGTEDLIRDSVLARWRSEQLQEYLGRLRQKRAVRVASPAAGPP